MSLDQILPNLILGACPSSLDDIGLLTQQAVTAVLNLQTDDDFRYLGIDWPRLHAQYFAQGIEVRRVPVQDFDDDELREKLPDCVRVLGELLDGGRTVYVHCSAGVNRSPSVVICYLHWTLGWDLDKAERHVRSCRRCSPVMEVVQLATRDRRQANR